MASWQFTVERISYKLLTEEPMRTLLLLSSERHLITMAPPFVDFAIRSCSANSPSPNYYMPLLFNYNLVRDTWMRCLIIAGWCGGEYSWRYRGGFHQVYGAHVPGRFLPQRERFAWERNNRIGTYWCRTTTTVVSKTGSCQSWIRCFWNKKNRYWLPRFTFALKLLYYDECNRLN